MNRVVTAGRVPKPSLEKEDTREELIRRVETSGTFEKSPRLRAFFLYVCQCALNGQPEAATEQQIGIHVFERPPGYNPGEDNVVRSQARQLRWKLEHHFANEGKAEPLIITIPKGQYLPVFEERAPATGAGPVPGQMAPVERRKSHQLRLLVGAAIAALALVAVWLAMPPIRSRVATPPPTVESTSPTTPAAAPAASPSDVPAEAGSPTPTEAAGAADEGIRIAAGASGGSFMDVWGRRWDGDRYYEGGITAPGPRDPFPPVADARLFRTLRESVTASSTNPLSKAVFKYNIPVRPGVYEMRLFFADPSLESDAKGREDTQNMRHFQVLLNGHTLLWDFDPVADGAPGAVDIRAFKDVTPDKDGMVHLEFIPGPERPFVNAIELTPGTPGKIRTIRICARPTDVVDSDGTRWGADNYFIHGRTILYASSDAGSGTQAAPYAMGERFGNFSYAIPAPPGSYTVKLYFAESFLVPHNTSGLCAGGAGCRVFDVSCNGEPLLKDFDVYQAAGGGFKTVVRAFHGLHPNGQGKLLLTFSSKANYAEVRAIEVIDEAK